MWLAISVFKLFDSAYMGMLHACHESGVTWRGHYVMSTHLLSIIPSSTFSSTEMAQVTQFSYFGIKPGNDILDASTEAGKVFAEIVDATLSQPGAKRVSYGLEVENPARVWLFVDWESLEHSLNYQKSA